MDRILVVEDVADVRLMLVNVLTREGCSVAEAASGRQALVRLSETIFDAILCDLDLGRGMSGLDVLECRPALNAETRFVMLTGHSTAGRREAVMARGASVPLEKPIVPAALIQALRPSADAASDAMEITSDALIGVLRRDDEHVQRALRIIECRFGAADFTVESLAREIGISPAHLARIFTKHVGVTPHESIEHQRMTAARDMLRDLRLPITNVAIDCGYRDLGEFDRAFKRVQGCSPTEWRARQGLQR